jgi:hypothetical protein
MEFEPAAQEVPSSDDLEPVEDFATLFRASRNVELRFLSPRHLIRMR